jgi:nucleolar protein 56
MYLYSCIIGSFVFNEHFKLKEKVFFSKREILENYLLLEQNKELDVEKKLKKRYKIEIIDIEHKKFDKILEFLRNYSNEFYEANKIITKDKISKSVNEDNLIIQAVDNITEIDRANNILIKRLREWYSLYFPELDNKIENNDDFVRFTLKGSKEKLMKELKIKSSMGSNLKKEDIAQILELAKQADSLYKLRDKHEKYLENIMEKYCKNLNYLAGTLVAAKLIAQSGSLKKLVLFPASTIQMLGAEKALFRHLTTGARTPKYGIILQHPFVQNAKKDIKGKAARTLADKISIAAKLDYFKGDFKAPSLKREMEQKFK